MRHPAAVVDDVARLGERCVAFYRRHRAFIGYMILVGFVFGNGFYTRLTDTSNDRNVVRAGRAAFEQIERERVVATLRSCHETNNERRAARRDRRRSLAQLAGVSDRILAELGTSRAEVTRDLHRELADLQPLPCAERAQRVRDRSPRFDPSLEGE
jgi:hypothetical protein